MSKELQLAEFKKFFLAARSLPKPCISDEDNAASLYRDDTGWTIQRKRAWMAVMCGAHYDFIDFSLTAGSEAGSAESRAKIRTWMKNLSEFIGSFDFIHAQPAEDWITTMPEQLIAGALARGSIEYVAYLADAREFTDSSAGAPISGTLSLKLDRGTHDLAFYSPVTGVYSPSVRLSSTGQLTIQMAHFSHDIVLRVTRVS
jgi:hypothetical protein